MALNRKYAEGDSFPLPVPVGTLSGGPVVIGDLPGVALIDRDADGEAACEFDGVFNFTVKGVVTGGGNGAIAVGTIVYLQSNGDINANSSSGKRFGYVLAAITSGATTANVPVKIGY